MNNISTIDKTEERTPIEIALDVNEEGWTTAKKLYDWLEYDPSNYSRWCKDNIVNNPVLEENVDFMGFSHHGENLQGGRPSTDYLISIEVAKEFAMMAKSEKGKAARKYFNSVEKGMIITVKQYNELLDCYKQLSNQMTALQERQDTFAIEQKEMSVALNKLESGRSVSGGHQSPWASKWHHRVRWLADAYGLTVSSMYDKIFNLMGEMHSFIWRDVKAGYVARHPEEGNDPWRIDVIDEAKGDLGIWFIEAYNELAVPYGLEDEEAYEELGYIPPMDGNDGMYHQSMSEEEFDEFLQGYAEYCEEQEKMKKANGG